MQLRRRTERGERRADHDVRPDRGVVQPFDGVVLAVLERLLPDYFFVESLRAFSGCFDVLDSVGADVDPDCLAELREVVVLDWVPEVGRGAVEERGVFGCHRECWDEFDRI